jgi:hypothetical protein
MLLQKRIGQPAVQPSTAIVEAIATGWLARELSPEAVARFYRGSQPEKRSGLLWRRVTSSRYLNDLPLSEWRMTIDFPQCSVTSPVSISTHCRCQESRSPRHTRWVLRSWPVTSGRGVGADRRTVPGRRSQVAGLMHDVGKLCVPDEIIDKRARLTPLEFSVMERHSFETYQILRHVPGLEQVAEWAAFHHEALNGQGYPFRRSAARLSTEARIVAVRRLPSDDNVRPHAASRRAGRRACSADIAGSKRRSACHRALSSASSCQKPTASPAR